MHWLIKSKHKLLMLDITNLALLLSIFPAPNV